MLSRSGFLRSSGLFVLVLLACACGPTRDEASSGLDNPEAAAADSGEVSPEGDGVAANREPATFDLGNYPAPPEEEWETVALDDDRYIQTTIEIACVSASTSGDPEAMRSTQIRVYYHHRTTAEALTAYGALVNADAARSLSLGREISEGIGRCPTVRP